MNDENNDTPSTVDVTNFLREEGFYDALMTEREMLDVYRAVSNSKNTASVEDEKRRFLEESSLVADTIDDLRLNSVPVIRDDFNLNSSFSSETSNAKDISIEISQQNNIFDEVDIFNSVPIKHPPLPRISYKPKYNPPLYCDPRIKHLSFEVKKKLIADYHKKLINIYDMYQRRSSKYAPLSKPVQSDVRFNGSLLKTESKSDTYDFEDDKSYEHSQDDNSNDVYILRSGRQTKRKLYSENQGDEKKFRPAEGIPKKKITVDSSIEKSASRLSLDRSKNRSEKLFDILIETQKKQDEKEKENESFMKSLQTVSDEDDSKDEFEVVQEPFIKRRIVPPLRGRGRQARGNKTNNATSKNNSKKTALKEITYEALPTVSSNISSNSSQGGDFGMCPLCNMRFPKDKLESHADQCLDLYEEKDTLFGGSRIACEKCDKVFSIDMDYELHVRSCLSN